MLRTAISSIKVNSLSKDENPFKSVSGSKMSQAPSLDDLLKQSAVEAGAMRGLEPFVRPGSASVTQSAENSDNKSFLQDAMATFISLNKNILLEELGTAHEQKRSDEDQSQVRNLINQVDRDLFLSIKRSQDSGINRDDLQRLKNLLNNPLFVDYLVNNPNGIRMLNEMLEAIKSDPFNLSAAGINFSPHDYEVFAKLESTGARSMVKAALGDELNSSLESVTKNNKYNHALLDALVEQTRFQPGVQSILNDKSISEVQKLSLLAKENADFVRSNMALYGAVENNGKLVPGLSNTEAITLVFGQGNHARESFTGEQGLLASLKGPANKGREFAYFDISDPNSAGAKLAQSLGVKIESGTDFSAAIITRDGVKFVNGDQSKPGYDKEAFQRGLDKAIMGNQQNQWLNPVENQLNNSQTHAAFDKLSRGQAQFLSTEGNNRETKTSNAFANLYASLVIEKFKAGKDESLKEGLRATEGSLASLADRIERRFNKSEKSSFRHDRNSFDDTLIKFSGLDQAKVGELKGALSGAGVRLNAMTTAVLLQGGITNSSQLGDRELTIMRDYQTAQGMSGRNSYNWYNQKLNEYVEKGYLPEYVLKHKAAAEQIMNINGKDGSTDNLSAFNMLGSVATIAHILEHPETAYKNGEGFYARLAIADGKDHNGAFGMNSGNHYMRGNEEAAFSLLRFGQIGNISIYAGNGMTDREFTARINRLIRTNDEQYSIGNRGVLASSNDNSAVRGLGLKHMSEEGHGNQSGNHGVIGSMDSGDKWRFAAYAALVRGDVFSLNCVACSNLGGSNSYGHVVLNEMARDLGKHVRLYSMGAEIPTPPGQDRATHLNGQISPSLVTNSDRIIFNQGKKETSPEEALTLSRYARDEFNITRAANREEDSADLNSSDNNNAYFASSR